LWSVIIVVGPNNASPSYHYSVVKVLTYALSRIIAHPLDYVKQALAHFNRYEPPLGGSGFCCQGTKLRFRGAFLLSPCGTSIVTRPSHSVKGHSPSEGTSCSAPCSLIRHEILPRPSELVKDPLRLRRIALPTGSPFSSPGWHQPWRQCQIREVFPTHLNHCIIGRALLDTTTGGIRWLHNCAS
jgi:hypothetical protein